MIATESHAPATLTPPRDPGGVIYSAINGTGFGVTVLPFYASFWGGTWTAAATYNAVDGTTTFTGDFGSPAGVSLSTGALAKALDSSANTFDDPGCMWLWSGYRYVPPQAGHEISGTTYGAHTGGNFLGQYYCWNRVYDVLTARWTTPDPAASPWTNLNGYAGNPVQYRDGSGLTSVDWRVSDTWDDAEAGSPEDTLWEAVRKHRKRWAKNWHDGKDDDGTSDVDSDDALEGEYSERGPYEVSAR